MSWKFIQEKSGLDNIKSSSRRNGRKQAEHLRIARVVRDTVNPDWRNLNGAPEKKDIVLKWRKVHPEGRKADCIRDTGLSKTTVRKWWDA